MNLAHNTFKQRLQTRQQQVGLWLALANAYTAEIAATVGFDWLLIDAEHAPNDLPLLLAQLQAIAPYASQVIIRPPSSDAIFIKQLLDIGAQTLLIPMVEDPQQARDLVKAIHYPPKGIRGVGSSLARASRWDSMADYLQKAGEEISLLIQIENLKGVQNLEAIAATEGLDGIFIGPSDLSAAMGHPGNSNHPDVQRVIANSIETINRSGKACGIYATTPDDAKRYAELGCHFMAVGADIQLLIRAMRQLLGQYKSDTPTLKPSSSY